MGNIDPATGAIKEYELPANSKPHTVEIDAKGNIWYTGNANGTLGYLDPKTGKITVFKMPDPKAKDPHTLVFDKNGIGWFTLQNSNMVGRIDPESGNIKLCHGADAGCQAIRHQDRCHWQSMVLVQRPALPVQDQSGEHGAD